MAQLAPSGASKEALAGAPEGGGSATQAEAAQQRPGGVAGTSQAAAAAPARLPPELAEPPQGQVDPAIQACTRRLHLQLAGHDRDCSCCCFCQVLWCMVACMLQVPYCAAWAARMLGGVVCVTAASAASPSPDPQHATCCPPDAQVRMDHLHRAKATSGKLLTAELRRIRDYKNPDFLEKMVKFHGIVDAGSNFPPHTFNPAGFPREDAYEECVPRPLP